MGTLQKPIGLEVASFIASCHDDPLAFVMGAYRWGEAGGPLEHEEGPDTWQAEFLQAIGEHAIRAKLEAQAEFVFWWNKQGPGAQHGGSRTGAGRKKSR